MSDPEQILRSLDELEAALESFRAAYTAWLDAGGEGDGAALSRALAEAEARLDAVRRLLASATDEQSYP